MIKREPIFRTPWRTDEQRAEILEEIRLAGVDADDLADKLDERARQSAEQYRIAKLTTQ
jgi:hypothetical protein